MYVYCLVISARFISKCVSSIPRSDPSFIPNVSLDPEPYHELRARYPDDPVCPAADQRCAEPPREEWGEVTRVPLVSKPSLASERRPGCSKESLDDEDSVDTESVMSDKRERLVDWVAVT